MPDDIVKATVPQTPPPIGFVRDSAVLFKGVIFSALAVAIFVCAVRDDPSTVIREAVVLAPLGVRLFLDSIKWLVPVLIVVIVAIPRDERIPRLSSAILAVLACSVFLAVFTTAKTTMVYAVPFYLDDPLEKIDRFLHFGYRPISLTHMLSPLINSQVAVIFYHVLWSVPAFFFPAILVLIDSDPDRRWRYYLLYFFAFMFLGWICALAGMSAGPVYHDYLVSEARFADLAAMQRAAGLSDTQVPFYQDALWQFFSRGENDAASGISAFPSVHIAITTIFGLYIFERWRWLRLIAVALPLWYQFLSVYTGWHYAVDGYFSIIAVCAAWYWLRSRDRRTRTPRAAVDRSGEAA